MPGAFDVGRWLAALRDPTLLLQFGLVLACLLLAWLIVRLLRGFASRRRGGVVGSEGVERSEDSIWFGARDIDGVLFPALALGLAMLLRWGLPALGHDAIPATVLRLAVPVLVSLLAIRVVARVLRSAFPGSALVGAIERSVSWLAWIGVVLWISGLGPTIARELDAVTWKVGSTRVSVRNLLEGAVAGIVVLMLALWAGAVTERRLLRGASDNISIRKMAANALRAVFLFVGLMFALSAAGIDLTALGVLGGALGVGIGFGLQKLAANYISGFVILAERSMRIGDIVKVDNFEGRITDISTRYTVIRALNGREAIVPNEMLITQRVENSSLADPRVLLTTTVQVAYGTDLDALMPKLVAAVGAVPRVLADPPPLAQLEAFAADGLQLLVPFWIGDPQNGHGNVRSAVNLALLRCLNDAGVEIPFPQRVMRGFSEPVAAPASAPAQPGA